MYLGLDLGTSGLKGLLIDGDQNIIGSATAPLDVTRPHSGWSEQDPAQWISACEAVFDELHRSHPAQLAAVTGIGLSGQMHGATLLDGEHKVLRPCMLWNDTRAHAHANRLDADPRFRQISGNIVFPGFTAPKVEWVRENEPHLFAKTALILLPKDYLRLWLTGHAVSDMSDAAGTSWLDVEKRDWSDDLLSATHLTRDHMPALAEGSDETGTLRPQLATRWGMQQAVVAGGAGDNAASAMGLGTIEPGAAFVSLGTSGVLFASNALYSPKPESAVHAFCHAVPETWHQMGVFLSATDTLNWWAGVTGKDAATLTATLDDGPAAPEAITFLPYLAGERTPHNDAAIRGAFIGLDHAHDQPAMTRAALQGVAFAMADSRDALAEAGTNLTRVMAVGGGTRSAHWLQTMANTLNLPLDLPAEGDFGAAFGAARLGLLAAEGKGADATRICTPPKIARSFEPDRTMTEAYGEAHRRYKALYHALKSA
ncbi:MAG: xylulokinase [Pseudomonadota bacterium]